MKKSYRIFRLAGFPSVKNYAVVRKENDAKEMNRFSGTCAGYASCRRIAQPDPMISPGRILPQDLTMPLFGEITGETG